MGRGRIENLTPWRQGQSGNPKGRPRKSPVTDQLEKLLELPVGDMKVVDYANEPFKVVLAKVLCTLAAEGNTNAWRDILNRVEGPPTERHEISGPEGGPIEAKINNDEFLEIMCTIYGVKNPNKSIPKGKQSKVSEPKT